MPVWLCVASLLLCALLTACRIEQEALFGGDIVSESGVRNCADQCTLDIEGRFIETFTGVPDPGYKFTGWKGQLCAGSLEPCALDIPEVFTREDISFSLVAGFSRKLAAGSFDSHQTEYFRVENFGFGSLTGDQYHEEYYYPTSEDYNPPGYGEADAHNMATGDFDGDGDQDLVINWLEGPHTIPKEKPSRAAIYLNDGTGKLVENANIFVEGFSPPYYFAYRIGVADFNGDGVDDIVSGPMGRLTRLANGGFDNEYERIPLLLSNGTGQLYDASEKIEGQENDQLIPGFQFAHDLSVGDVDGDGDPDFFTGLHLFINDGEGNFTNATSRLPRAIDRYYSYAMSSLIHDFDNDGIGDIVVFYGDGSDDGSSSYVFLSAGRTDLPSRQATKLPWGYFGRFNTKHNHAAAGDLDGNGWADIVIGQTRAEPYYHGRALQILMNYGDGRFVDESSQRIRNGFRATLTKYKGGEGVVTLLDVNGDGNVDIVDEGNYSDGYQVDDNFPGLDVFLNNGEGEFERVPTEFFAYVDRWQLEGFGDPGDHTPLNRAHPIDLDGLHGIDFVSSLKTAVTRWPEPEPLDITLYQLRSLKRLPTPD